MTKTSAAGSKLQVLINATYVDIPGLEGIPEFGPEKAEYDNTAIDDLSKTFGDDIPDNGDLTIMGSWDSKNAAHAYLLSRANTASTTDSFKTLFHSGATALFSGKCMRFRTSANKGQDEKFSTRIRLVSVVNYTAAP